MAKPAAWKNSYFWFAAFLFIVAVYGLIRGESSVRDPGQVDEGGLIWIYFGGAILMLINGIFSHKQTVRAYEEEMELGATVATATPSFLQNLQEEGEVEPPK